MFRFQLSLAFAVVFVGCSHPDDDRIKCTVEKFQDTVFAEWGKDEAGERWEHRFDGIKVRIEHGGQVEIAWFVQPWFPSSRHPRKEFPKVGETFYLKSLPQESRVVPIEEPSYWYYEVVDSSGESERDVNRAEKESSLIVGAEKGLSLIVGLQYQ